MSGLSGASPPRPSAIITGGSRGIGHGIATVLAADGWALTLNARDPVRLRAVADALSELGGEIHCVAGDLADDNAIAELVAHHESSKGTLNALILAAGVGSAAPIDRYPMSRFDKQFAVNIRAPFALVSRALPLLRAGAVANPERGGRIIALASIEGVHPDAGLAAYGASKAALISIIQSINAEEGANGVTASAISPAFVDTDMSNWVHTRIPANQMITIADVVKVAQLILSLSPTAVLPHIVINRAAASSYHA